MRGVAENECRYRELFENDPTGIFVATPGGLLVACNSAFAHIFGFSSVDEALESSLTALYPSRAAHDEMLARLQAQTCIGHHEVELRRRDGRTIYVLAYLVGTFEEGGGLVEIQGYLIDNGAWRQLEAEFRQAHKMEAVGRLAGGISHDFNNLLTAIVGYCELVLSQSPPGDSRRADIEEIKAAGLRAAKLTHQLLAFSRQQLLQPQILDLNEVVADVSQLLRRVIGEDIELVIAADPTLGRIKADPGQLEQVLINLAVNARDAMPDGGRLIIETANLQFDRTYVGQHVGAREGSYVMVAVSDNGCGMDAETQSRIFEPFFTTKEPGKGTGLGLSTVYGIVRQSEGYIWVYSEPGKGTSLKIYFPRSEEALLVPSPQPRGEAPTGAETILLVEDDDAVRALLIRLLERQGYNVVSARHGGEALRVSDEHKGPVHLLMTDLIMPGMAGEALAARLVAKRPELRVLYMSGYRGNVGTCHVGTHRVGFLEKPFKPEAVASKVREALDTVVRAW